MERRSFLDQTEAGVHSLCSSGVPDERELLPHLDSLQVANREAVSPVDRLQHLLHGWVAFGIMPLFAFANAGVALGEISLKGDSLWVFIGIMFGLAVRKPVGILGLSWLAARSGVAALPSGLKWSHVSVVAIVRGNRIHHGFVHCPTGLSRGPLLETAKLAILCGSALAATVSLVAGSRILTTDNQGDAAITDVEAETSTAR